MDGCSTCEATTGKNHDSELFVSLKDLLSTHMFFSCTLHDFQNRVRRWYSSVSSGTQAVLDVETSLNEVDWLDVLRQHEQQKATQRIQQPPQLSILSVFLELWSSSSQAATMTATTTSDVLVLVCQALVRTILDHGGTPGTREAQLLIRKFLMDMLRRETPEQQQRMIAQIMPIRTNAAFATSTLRVSRIQARLALLKEWSSEFRGLALIPKVCFCLNLLDHLEIAFAGIVSGKANVKTPPTPKPRRNIRGRGNATMVDRLHDDVSDNDDQDDDDDDAIEYRTAGHASKRQRVYHPNRSAEANATSIVPAVKVLRSSVTNRGDHQKDLRHKFRNKAIKRLLEISSLSYEQVLSCLLEQAAIYNSPSICWTCVLMVQYHHHKRSDGININDNYVLAPLSTLTDAVWNQQQKHQEQQGAGFGISLYFEILSDCACFDQSPLLWKALQPFVRYVCNNLALDSIEAPESVEPSTHSKTTAVKFPTTYRHSFGWFLTRRGAMLKNVKEFAPFVAQVSALYGNAQDWMDEALMTKSQRRTIIFALQQVGILGMSSLLASVDSIQELKGPQRLRRASQWCTGDRYRQTELLSTLSPVNGVPPQPPPTRVTPKPVYLNPDALAKIFSFLGFKTMVGLRQVSKEWQDVADSNRLWYDFYLRRWELLPNDPLASVRNGIPWKRTFEYQWAAEREVLARRSQSTLNFCICRYVACTCIFPSSVARQRHHLEHERGKREPKRRHGRTHKRKSFKSSTPANTNKNQQPTAKKSRVRSPESETSPTLWTLADANKNHQATAINARAWFPEPESIPTLWTRADANKNQQSTAINARGWFLGPETITSSTPETNEDRIFFSI